MIYSYVRVSTADQSLQSQQSIINDYVVRNKLIIDETIEAHISSRKSPEARKIIDLISKLQSGDTLICSELSRLGRSLAETLQLVDQIKDKQVKLILIKNNLVIDTNSNDINTKIMLTVFSLIDDLSRTYISERTKAGLKALTDKGIKLGKPVGTVQLSMYDKDKDRILELVNLGVPVKKIIDTHLKYGKYQSLLKYINKTIKRPIRSGWNEAFKEFSSKNTDNEMFL